jgi:phasin
MKGATKTAFQSAETVANKSAETINKASETAARTTEAAVSGLDMPVPEAVRAMAERTVSQTREAYDQARSALEETVDTLEKSLDKAGQGAAALNRKAIDMAQTNLNSSFDLARELAGAKTLAEIIELHSSFARRQFGTLMAQAEEFRALSTKVATETSEPFKAHVSRSMQFLSRAS